jgi:cytochrome c oxidase cbb3-type subunit 3
MTPKEALMGAPERDPLTGQYTTGHSWDGIKELRTPIPAWWLSIWLASIAFALGYIVLYPSFPSLNGAVSGDSSRTAREDLVRARARPDAAQAELRARIAALDVEAIGTDPELARFAFRGGKAAFAVHCAGCHGSDAGGQIGQFPSLVDDDWLWGGNLTQIHQTISHGIRNEDPDSRASQMPAFGDILSDREIRDVVAHVAALGDRRIAPVARAAMPGAAVFEQNCAACHGEAGEGNRDMGAPRLSDRIWLYGGSPAAIEAQIRHPRMGVMPAWEKRIGSDMVKMLAIYVHGLGGGEASPPPAAPAPAAAGSGLQP